VHGEPRAPCRARRRLGKLCIVRLRVHVAPSAAKDEIVGPYGNGWKVRVRAAPERGKANEAVIRLLAETLRVPADAVSVVAGHASKQKVVEVAGLDEKEVGAAARRRRPFPSD
jgi:uncharacterized protein